MARMPKYPIFIPSKGRAGSPLTIRSLQRAGVPFQVVVEPQQYDEYAQVVDPSQLLVTPHQDQGLVVTRNWIWDYATALGVSRFWTFDDNIRMFFRFHQNKKTPLASPAFLVAIEEWADRYTNAVIVGMNYEMFVAHKRADVPPLQFNTRVYSNMLIDTFATDRQGRPYRNEGFYNDDTDLCLRVLKDGHCTVLFNAFLADKAATMLVKGGMTPHYQGDGRLKMAQELVEKHPDVCRVTWRYSRWQHYCDYRPFRGNKLIRRPDVQVEPGTNEYGMTIIRNR